MRNRWHKISKMSLSESTMKTASSTTTKRFQMNMIVNQVFKFFTPTNRTSEENSKPKNLVALPSISITSPEGLTTALE